MRTRQTRFQNCVTFAHFCGPLAARVDGDTKQSTTNEQLNDAQGSQIVMICEIRCDDIRGVN